MALSEYGKWTHEVADSPFPLHLFLMDRNGLEVTDTRLYVLRKTWTLVEIETIDQAASKVAQEYAGWTATEPEAMVPFGCCF